MKNKNIKPGDDYSMIKEVITRRFKRLVINTDKSFTTKPNIIILDGGLGQCNVAAKVLKILNVENIYILGIAKNKNRNSGNEKIYFSNEKKYTPNFPNKPLKKNNPLKLSSSDSMLYFFQRIRDEAHRFALTAQRTRTKKLFTSSSLDLIQGIGPKKRKALILRFGSTKNISEANISELSKTSGINISLAKQIFNFYNG